MLKSEQADDHKLGELIQAAIPTNWPPVDWEPHVLDFILTQFQEHPEQIGWHRYVLFRHPDGARSLIGALGAFSKGVPPSECEIGYSILPPFEGRGFATEGTRALIAYLREDARIDSIIAHTFPRLAGSIRVMESAGSPSTAMEWRRERFAIGCACVEETDYSLTLTPRAFILR